MSAAETQINSSDTDNGAAGSASLASTGFDMPSVEQILSSLPERKVALPPRGEVALSQEEEGNLLRALQTAIEDVQDTTEAGIGFDLKELHSSLAHAAETRPNHRYFPNSQKVLSILDQLWSANSEFLSQAAEKLANRSRDRESVSACHHENISYLRFLASWRAPYGQSGVLKFFLEIIASQGELDNGLLLHSLRIVGNSCADTGKPRRLLMPCRPFPNLHFHSDENRAVVIDGEYVVAIIRHLLNPNLIHVAIPVIYNICMDYGETSLSGNVHTLCANLQKSLLMLRWRATRWRIYFSGCSKMVPWTITVRCSALHMI